MSDLSTTIAPKSDQLNADDLIGGATKTITVTKVSLLGETDQPVAVNFQGDNGKPYKPCKSMRRVLVHVWGKDGNAYIGRSMTLYRDDKVKFGGMDVGGIRISHMSHIDSPVTMALTATKASRKPYTVKPLAVGATPKISDALRAEAIEAADGGVRSYTEWLASLPPEVKANVKPFHSEFSRIAKEADAMSEINLSSQSSADAFPGDTK